MNEPFDNGRSRRLMSFQFVIVVCEATPERRTPGKRLHDALMVFDARHREREVEYRSWLASREELLYAICGLVVSPPLGG